MRINTPEIENANMKGFCSVCRDITVDCPWPTENYLGGKVFCSEECENKILENNPNLPAFGILVFHGTPVLSSNYFHMKNYTFIPNFETDILFRFWVYAETREAAVKCAMWIYPGYNVIVSC